MSAPWKLAATIDPSFTIVTENLICFPSLALELSTPETVTDGQTGVLFDGATAHGVRHGLDRLRARSWDRALIEARAADFSPEACAARIRAVVDGASPSA